MNSGFPETRQAQEKDYTEKPLQGTRHEVRRTEPAGQMGKVAQNSQDSNPLPCPFGSKFTWKTNILHAQILVAKRTFIMGFPSHTKSPLCWAL